MIINRYFLNRDSSTVNPKSFQNYRVNQSTQNTL